MPLSQLILKNFRSFSSKELRFYPDFNFILGCNGAGKSSVLEAVYYTCYASSFRSANKEDMIKDGEQAFFIQATTESENEISIGASAEEKVLKINGRATTSHKEVASIIRAIILQQKDINLICGYNEDKKLFLKQLLYLQSDDANKQYAKLNKILIQRKTLLEQQKTSSSEFQIWTEKLIETSQEITQAQKIALEKLTTIAKEIVSTFAPQIILEIKFEENKYHNLEQLRSTLEKERILEKNLIGANQNCFEIKFKNKDAKNFSSRGEQKVIVFILKTAMLEATSIKIGARKVFLIDDFFSELDPQNLKTCLDILKKINAQKLIATPTQDLEIKIQENL